MSLSPNPTPFPAMKDPTCSPSTPGLPMTTRPGNKCDTRHDGGFPYNSWWYKMHHVVCCAFSGKKRDVFSQFFGVNLGVKGLNCSYEEAFDIMRMKQRPCLGVFNTGLLPDLWDKFSFQTKNLTSCKTRCTPLSNKVAVHSQFGPKVDKQQNLNNPKIPKLMHLPTTNEVSWFQRQIL